MRGRFAPGPTGYLHLGNVWTALLSWLQVRQQGGTWVLRLEDVDEQRSRAVFARSILRDITWLGLTWDEGPRIGGPYAPYIQQQRYGLYMRALQLLQRQGLLYPCYCNRARLQTLGAPHAGERHVYDGCCYKRFKKNMAPPGDKPPSRRVHVPPDTLVFADLQYGRQETALRRDGGDFVVRRADGLFTYALAAVVDDGAMAITHVVRGAIYCRLRRNKSGCCRCWDMTYRSICMCRCWWMPGLTGCPSGNTESRLPPCGTPGRIPVKFYRIWHGAAVWYGKNVAIPWRNWCNKASCPACPGRIYAWRRRSGKFVRCYSRNE